MKKFKNTKSAQLCELLARAQHSTCTVVSKRVFDTVSTKSLLTNILAAFCGVGGGGGGLRPSGSLWDGLDPPRRRSCPPRRPAGRSLSVWEGSVTTKLSRLSIAKEEEAAGGGEREAKQPFSGLQQVRVYNLQGS